MLRARVSVANRVRFRLLASTREGEHLVSGAAALHSTLEQTAYHPQRPTLVVYRISQIVVVVVVVAAVVVVLLLLASFCLGRQ